MNITNITPSPLNKPDFELLFESSPGLYLVLLPDPRFTIVGVSNAYLKATMTVKDKILGKGLFEVFPDNPDDPNATGTFNLNASLNRVLQTKGSDTMAVQKYDVRKPQSEGGEFEVRYWSPVNSPVLKDGKIIYIIHRVEDVTNYIKLKELGADQLMINKELASYKEKTDMEMYLRSVERQKIQDTLIKTQNKLLMANSLLKGIIEGTNDIIAAYDTKYNVVFFNKAYANKIKALYGKDIKTNMNILELLQHIPNEQLKMKNNLEKAFKEEFKTVHEFGDSSIETRIYEQSYYSLKLENNENGVFQIARDVTERIKHEHDMIESQKALTIANKDLESFTYTVSHDLRAPLRSIDGFSKILLEKYLKDLPQDAQRILKLIDNSATEMGLLIDNLLHFSRLGNQNITKQSLSLNNLTKEVLNTFSEKIKQNAFEIKINQLPDGVGDVNLVRQALVNLISNAIKFTQKSKNPSIEIGSITHDNNTPVYYIKDNGAGFDMRYAKKLFGVFQRLHKAEEFEGTGVGLAIVKRIIEKHDGKVWAESEPNRGTTFYFTLGDHPNETHE